MKTKTAIQLIALTVLIIFSSCKKDDNTKDLKYSPLTVEQNKANIEDEGINMLNSVKAMEALPATDAAVSMLNFTNKADLFANNPNQDIKNELTSKLLKPLMIAANLKEFNAKHVANDLKVQLEPTSLLEEWNNIKGTYTWNSGTTSWTWAASDELIIKFPSTESGTTNNVEFRVYDFLYVTGPFDWANGLTGELPKQIKAELKVDGTSILSYSLSILYGQTDKKPYSISTSLELPPFKFAFDVSSTNDSDASVSFKWTNNTDILVALSLSANGDWSETNLTQEYLEPGDVFNTGNASFQLMNIKLVGNVNVKKLNEEINNISPNLSEESAKTKECELIGKYASLYVCYADNNLVIAKVVVYSIEKTNYYWNYIYNPITQDYELVEESETYWDIQPKFVFADKSSVDLDTYFGDKNAFSELKTAVENYLNELQTNYCK